MRVKKYSGQFKILRTGEMCRVCGLVLVEVSCDTQRHSRRGKAWEHVGNLERGVPVGHESAGFHVDHLGRTGHEIHWEGAVEGRSQVDLLELDGGPDVRPFEDHLQGLLAEGLVHAGNLGGLEVL